MLKVVDYGAGNLFSLANALKFCGIDFAFASKPEELVGDGILLPGVGAFPKAMEMLEARSLLSALKSPKAPMLGICLGMQLLFSHSEEFGSTEGLGLIPGEIRRIEGDVVIPHMGWNSLRNRLPSPITAGVAEGSYAYFVHSFRAVCDEKYIASDCEYGGSVPAVVQNGSVFGCQFHPEKSGEIGLSMLKNFNAFCLEGKK